MGSLSRRTGPEPWSSEEMWCLQRGEARSFRTNALNNYEVRVAARVEEGGGRFPWGVNAGGGSRFATCGGKPY